MKIGEFSALTGLSAHTLRYYEKIGLLMVQRDSSGHRHYSSKELEWIAFINRLRQTNMPLEKIRQYAQWRAQGESTAVQRQQLLISHADNLKESIHQEQKHLRALEQKIHWYEQQNQE